MPVICLEGASAVGKTTTSRAFAGKHSAYVVPEVNQLFERPKPEAASWYFERQVDRWSIALEKLKTHEIVVLDGDPFQPLWYNWSYNFGGWQPLEYLAEFYRTQIERGLLAFPNLYVLLMTDENALRFRKENDQTRTRRGFEVNLRFIESQKRYFAFMNSIHPRMVEFVQTTTFEENIQRISLALLRENAKHLSSLDLFDKMIAWLQTNTPDQKKA